jgi:hypothetical protein
MAQDLGAFAYFQYQYQSVGILLYIGHLQSDVSLGNKVIKMEVKKA